MPRVPADAPYLAATNSPRWKSIGVDVPLNNLARLAAGVGYNTWNLRHNRLRTLDLSALRVHRWNEASRQMAYRWTTVKRSNLLMKEKRDMSLWLVRKHAVLAHALSVGEILQIDVLAAVVRRSSCGCLSPLSDLTRLFPHSSKSMSRNWKSTL